MYVRVRNHLVFSGPTFQLTSSRRPHCLLFRSFTKSARIRWTFVEGFCEAWPVKGSTKSGHRYVSWKQVVLPVQWGPAECPDSGSCLQGPEADPFGSVWWCLVWRSSEDPSECRRNLTVYCETHQSQVRVNTTVKCDHALQVRLTCTV